MIFQKVLNFGVSRFLYYTTLDSFILYNCIRSSLLSAGEVNIKLINAPFTSVSNFKWNETVLEWIRMNASTLSVKTQMKCIGRTAEAFFLKNVFLALINGLRSFIKNGFQSDVLRGIQTLRWKKGKNGLDAEHCDRVEPDMRK